MGTWTASATTSGYSWTDGMEWDIFDTALGDAIGEKTGTNCFLYNDEYPYDHVKTIYTNDLEFNYWTAAEDFEGYPTPAIYLLPESYAEYSECDTTNFYAWEVPAEDEEPVLDTCTLCSNEVGLEVEADPTRTAEFGFYETLSCANLTESNAANFCESETDVCLYEGCPDTIGMYYLGEMFLQFCPYTCKKFTDTLCQAKDFSIEFVSGGTDLTCDMVADDLELCETTAIWWTCPETRYYYGKETTGELESNPTSSPTPSPTSSPTIDCEDKSKKEFEIDVDFEGTIKTKDCEWVASKKKSKRKEYCKSKVTINGNEKKLHKICLETCGLVGKGECSFLKDQQNEPVPQR